MQKYIIFRYQDEFGKFIFSCDKKGSFYLEIDNFSDALNPFEFTVTI
jgi:hypothetical protein